MMKRLLVMSFAVIVIAAVFGCSKAYETQKSMGDVNVTLSAERYPLVKGDNTLNVKVTDAGGKAINDAKVDVRYYMPPMPGMAPMEYTTQPVPKGSAYTFGANIPMEGGWKVDVSVTPPGKPAFTATFNLDAR